ncbi:hypothetical protein PHLCEN_2v11705 [Hermanssonia centrifuga]|uniref:Uncharacterized protein n=1 Tax=Hermanssonia centrifuga TaxID=98765 RepID=A0A2R6NJ89_9APHY|nr:hypothetical protein PHLCEN_2v11705 [Hermanssonia centrifuga]
MNDPTMWDLLMEETIRTPFPYTAQDRRFYENAPYTAPPFRARQAKDGFNWGEEVDRERPWEQARGPARGSQNTRQNTVRIRNGSGNGGTHQMVLDRHFRTHEDTRSIPSGSNSMCSGIRA